MNVERISGGQGRDFIREHHYTRSCHNGPMTWGLFVGGALQGVIAFATPCSEAVRASLFGPEHKDSVTELHRLFTFDHLPSNTETWFIAKALKGLKQEKPKIKAVISFADGTEGHHGGVYQASNALYLGTTGRKRFYRDGEGRLRHPRQNGKNITLEDAEKLGWTPEMRDAKHRYVFLVGSSSDKKWAKANLIPTVLEYPKEAL